MGNTISLYDPKLHDGLKQDLSQLKIDDIIEIAGVINDFCFGRTHLNQYDFEDIFSLSLNHATEFFNQLKETPDGFTVEVVSIYEAIAALTFLCHDQYEKKISYLFNIFDFDNSFDLTGVEFEMTVSTLSKSLSKILEVETPSNEECQNLTTRYFHKIDTDMDNSVIVEELIDYLKGDFEIQDFLLTYTHSTSHENACRRFNEMFELSEGAYQKYLETEKHADMELAMQLSSIFSIKESYCEHLIFLSKNNNKTEKIDKNTYDSVCRAVAAYKAIDIKNTEEIGKCNYYLIIWLFDGQEPDDYKVKIGMNQLDADHNSMVSLKEWINFLCLNNVTTNTQQFKGNLRKQFVRLDDDHSGYLEREEVKEIFHEALRTWVKDLKETKDTKVTAKSIKKNKGLIELTINAIVNRLFAKMRVNHIHWENFDGF